MNKKFLYAIAMLSVACSTFSTEYFQPTTSSTNRIAFDGYYNSTDSEVVELIGSGFLTGQAVTVSSVSAIEDAISNAQPGAVINVTAGTYDFSSGSGTLTLPNGAALVGQGAGATFENVHIDASAGDNIIKNITFNRSAAPTLYQTSHAGLNTIDVTMQMGLKNRERSIVADSTVTLMKATDEGWQYENTVSSPGDGRKANLHFFTHGFPDDEISALDDFDFWNIYNMRQSTSEANVSTTNTGSIFVKVKYTSGTSTPFVQVYTHKKYDGDDAGWYRSRLKYLPDFNNATDNSIASWDDAKNNDKWVVLYLGDQPTSADFGDILDGTEVFVPLTSGTAESTTNLRSGLTGSAADKFEDAEKDAIKQITLQNGSNGVSGYVAAGAGYKFDDDGTMRKNQVVLKKANPEADYIVAGHNVAIENCTFNIKNADATNQYAASAITTVFGDYSKLLVKDCTFNGDASDNGGIGVILNPMNASVAAPQILNSAFNNLGSGVMCDSHSTSSADPVFLKDLTFNIEANATLENIGFAYPSSSGDIAYAQIEGYTSSGAITKKTSSSPEVPADYDAAFLGVLNNQGNEVNIYHDQLTLKYTDTTSVGPIGTNDSSFSGHEADVARFISNLSNDSSLAGTEVNSQVNTTLDTITQKAIRQAVAVGFNNWHFFGVSDILLRTYDVGEENTANDSLDISYSDLSFSSPVNFSLAKIKENSSGNYVIFGSTRDGAQKPQLLVIESDGNSVSNTYTLDTAELETAYGSTAGIPFYSFNDVVVQGDFAYVVGTVQEDVAGPASFNKVAFVGVVDLVNGNWEFAPTIISENNEDLEMLSLALDVTNAELYVAGYNSSGGLVQKYDVVGLSGSPTNTPTDLTKNTTFGDETVGSAGDKACAIALHYNGSNNGFVVAVAKALSVNPVLSEEILIQRDSDDSAENWTTEYTFDAVPQMAPLSFDPVFPEYTYNNANLSINIGSDNEIFVAGTLAAHALPFVYKLNSDGSEADYAKNFAHDVNANEDTVQALVHQPVLYPVVGKGWSGTVQGVYASAIDTTNNWLYLFGTKGDVNRNADTSSAGFTNLEIQDVAHRVTTGNLTIAANVDDVKVEAVYSENNITLQIVDGNSEALETSVDGMTFANFTLHSSKQTITSTGNADIEVYGTVEVSRTHLGSGQPSVTSEIVVLSTSGDGEDLGIIVDRGNANELRLVDGSANVLDDATPPTSSNGGIRQGTLVGTMSDGTVIELTMNSLELVDAQLVADLYGSVDMTLTNNYTELPNGYTLRLDPTNNLPASLNVSLTEYDNTNNASALTGNLTDLKLDVIETEGEANPVLFGYAVVDGATVPVHGELETTIANNQISSFTDGSVSVSDISNPTGSYVVGRNKDMRVTIALTEGTPHRQIRSAIQVEFDADLNASNASGSVSVSDISNVANTPAHFTVDDSDVNITSVTRAFTRSGQHKIRINGSVDLTLDETSETITVPVGGEFVFNLSSDLSVMTPQKKFVLKGSLNSSNTQGDQHGLVTVRVRINNVESVS